MRRLSRLDNSCPEQPAPVTNRWRSLAQATQAIAALAGAVAAIAGAITAVLHVI